MNKEGYIEIKITGKIGNIALSPDNYDIRELIAILENAENLLYPDSKKNRPTVSYKMEEGSVKHVFKTSLQYIIGFNAIIGEINLGKNNIDFLELKTAQAFENIQEIATKKDYIFSIETSLDNSNKIKIDRNTQFYRTEPIWADAEFYFYGKVTNAGGKDKANIHLATEELGTIRISTPKSFLQKYENNILYRTFGIRATGKQYSETGEIDTNSLKFVELLDYEAKYDEFYLKNLRKKAKNNWLKSIDSEKWLMEYRGSYEE